MLVPMFAYNHSLLRTLSEPKVFGPPEVLTDQDGTYHGFRRYYVAKNKDTQKTVPIHFHASH